MEESIAIFYFSSIPYGFLYQRPQQLYREIPSAERPNIEAFYVEPPRMNFWDLYRALIRHNASSSKSGKDDRILSLPIKFHSRAFRGYFDEPINAFIVNKILEKYCRAFDKTVAICCMPFWESLISRKNFDLICYDYLDAIEVQRNAEIARLQHWRMIEKSDIIFVTAKSLKDEILSLADHKEIVMVSNGVNVDFFEKNKRTFAVHDYRKRGRKVAGYVGALYEWIDIDLIIEAAKVLPNIDFVLVGPLSKSNSSYGKIGTDNVFFLGEKDYSEVPAYIDLFDVALIPFKTSVISDSTDPIKLYEYFSLGKPVVSTHMRQLIKYSDQGLLKMAGSIKEFVHAIESLSEEDNELLVAARKQVALKNSWSSKADIMRESIMRYLH